MDASNSNEVRARVDAHMRATYGKSLDDMLITNTPGAWIAKQGDGEREQSCFGHAASQMYFYKDERRCAKGVLRSPYASWKSLGGKSDT